MIPPGLDPEVQAARAAKMDAVQKLVARAAIERFNESLQAEVDPVNMTVTIVAAFVEDLCTFSFGFGHDGRVHFWYEDEPAPGEVSDFDDKERKRLAELGLLSIQPGSDRWPDDDDLIAAAMAHHRKQAGHGSVAQPAPNHCAVSGRRVSLRNPSDTLAVYYATIDRDGAIRFSDTPDRSGAGNG